MKWSTSPKHADAQHAPVTSINGDNSRPILKITVQPDQKIVLDASTSCSPDSSKLKYRWWQYLWPSSNNNNPAWDVALLKLSGETDANFEVQNPSEEIIRLEGSNTHLEADKHLLSILKVHDGQLMSYKEGCSYGLGAKCGQERKT